MIRKSLAAMCKAIVLLVAAGVFFFVPIGRRTAFGHLQAIFTTPEAQEAAESVGAAGQELKDKVMNAVR